uniref:Peptidase M13 N-terminal domain-containing protein n=1 Tax=Timema tahoe TaxID=61484 RepID=A0A7R9IRQ5_9NEOP|nr:unnamed protein product [Timema tahoe]
MTSSGKPIAGGWEGEFNSQSASGSKIGPVKFGVAGRENRRARLMELVFSQVVVARYIDWKEYFDDAMQHRSKKIKPDYEMVVVYAPGYLKDLSSLIMNLNNTNENNIVLNNYLVWQTVRSLTGYLSKAFRDAYKGLRKALVGSEGGEESWRYCVSDTNNVIGFAIGAMFVREVFHGNSKPMAEDMINEIREAFKRNLKMLSWMDQETREAAERKADAITDMIDPTEAVRSATSGSYWVDNPNHLGGISGDESGDNGGPGRGVPALGKGGKRRKPKGIKASRASHQPGTSGSGPAPKAKEKIPPIILYDVEDYSKVARAIRTKIREPVEVVRQSISPPVRVGGILPRPPEILAELGIQHWSYELGRERLVMVVVKGLLTWTNPGYIQEELMEMGFPMKSITQMLSQWKRDQNTGERQRWPNFIVSLTPGEHTARLYQYCAGSTSGWRNTSLPEAWFSARTASGLGMCGGIAALTLRVGTSGGDHERGGCLEERQSPPKCPHCSGSHSSTWGGCPTYRSLRAAGTVRASKGQKPSGHIAVRKVTVTPAPEPKPLVQSFASALSGKPTPPPQAEATPKATLPEPLASDSSRLIEDPSKTAPLPIITLTSPSPAPCTSFPTL